MLRSVKGGRTVDLDRRALTTEDDLVDLDELYPPDDDHAHSDDEKVQIDRSPDRHVPRVTQQPEQGGARTRQRRGWARPERRDQRRRRRDRGPQPPCSLTEEHRSTRGPSADHGAAALAEGADPQACTPSTAKAQSCAADRWEVSDAAPRTGGCRACADRRRRCGECDHPATPRRAPQVTISPRAAQPWRPASEALHHSSQRRDAQSVATQKHAMSLTVERLAAEWQAAERRQARARAAARRKARARAAARRRARVKTRDARTARADCLRLGGDAGAIDHHLRGASRV